MDTSFLLTMLSHHREIDEELRDFVPGRIKICLLDRIIFELERIRRTKNSGISGLANAGLELVEKRAYLILETKDGPSQVDDALLSFVLASRGVPKVATVDKQLGRVLVLQGVSTIYFSRQKGLMFLPTTSLSDLNKRQDRLSNSPSA